MVGRCFISLVQSKKINKYMEKNNNNFTIYYKFFKTVFEKNYPGKEVLDNLPIATSMMTCTSIIQYYLAQNIEIFTEDEVIYDGDNIIYLGNIL